MRQKVDRHLSKKPDPHSGELHPDLRKQSFPDGSYCYALHPNGLAPYGRFSISGPATPASLPFPALPRSDPKNLNGGKDNGNYHQNQWEVCVR